MSCLYPRETNPGVGFPQPTAPHEPSATLSAAISPGVTYPRGLLRVRPGTLRKCVADVPGFAVWVSESLPGSSVHAPHWPEIHAAASTHDAIQPAWTP